MESLINLIDILSDPKFCTCLTNFEKFI